MGRNEVQRVRLKGLPPLSIITTGARTPLLLNRRSKVPERKRKVPIVENNFGSQRWETWRVSFLPARSNLALRSHGRLAPRALRDLRRPGEDFAGHGP